AQLITEPDHLLRLDCRLVPGLSSRYQVKAVETLVLYEGLLDPAVALDYVHEVVNDPVFEPHHYIEVSQADISIDQNCLAARQCQTGPYVRCRCGFAHP